MIYTYYLVCTEAQISWIKWLCKKKHGHILILKQSEYGWVEIDPTYSQLQIKILPYLNAQDVAQAYATVSKSTVIKINKMRKTKSYHFMRIFGCIGLVQYVIKTRYLVFTPWQLCKKLIKNNEGEIIYGQ